MPDLWGVASIATKFALYLGVFTSVGTVFAALLFRFEAARSIITGFAALGIGATLMGFSLAGARLTGDASGMTDPEMLGLLWSTSVGTTVALRLAGLGLLIAGFLARAVVERAGMALCVVGGLLALSSFATVGHIPDRDSLSLSFVLMFHLAAISVWIGVLAPLRHMARDAAQLGDAVDLGHRFGKMAAVFVPLLILAGGYMSFALVGSFSALWAEGYGQALLLKGLFVAGLLSLAAANKLWFIPQMAGGSTAAARRLARSISFEWLVILAVLLTTAVLTSALTPQS